MPLTRFAYAVLTLCLVLCSCGVSAERGRQVAPQSPANAGAKEQAPTKEQVPAVAPRPQADPNKFAIIIAGVGGEEDYTKRFTAQATGLYDALVNRLGFDEKNVTLLTEAGAGGPENGSREMTQRATAAEVRAAFGRISKSATARSLIFVTLIGHGSFDTQQAKFNLVGPDLSAKDYAALIASLPAGRIVFVNSASSSGEFVKALSAENRIVITATRSGNEQNATIFAEHFIAGLTSPDSDADKNNRISVLEAFNYATKVTADYYKQNGRLATEHALIDDNGDGVGHEEQAAGDGVAAKTTYLDSKAVEQAAGDAELGRLIAERSRLEEAVEKLKARKGEMKPDDYETELERLLVELARVSQAIKARPK